MRLWQFTPRYMQAAEREEDVLPRDSRSRHELRGSQTISMIDPITCQDVGDIEGKPFLIDGGLILYFESELTRQRYLNEMIGYSPK